MDSQLSDTICITRANARHAVPRCPCASLVGVKTLVTAVRVTARSVASSKGAAGTQVAWVRQPRRYEGVRAILIAPVGMSAKGAVGVKVASGE